MDLAELIVEHKGLNPSTTGDENPSRLCIRVSNEKREQNVNEKKLK